MNSATRSAKTLQHHDSENWRVQLYTDQYYLGVFRGAEKDTSSTLIRWKTQREGLVKSVLPELKKAIDTMFGPDLYNCASVSNSEGHLHYRVAATQGVFAGQVFTDEGMELPLQEWRGQLCLERSCG